ncbi:MAG: UDP-N-acetylmuramoyl-L-alanyl-D-glutamate--2,6-diaminopimelate ligase [Deltaproteobacteria bacterium]|jgi:UDP-N-acetylmuramoyl-L-alanyl-D-glutamate--2,6-diaminopimelate ligase|nr:UDP-N-acetylmuramoyl-L-alanyl-D-glutamate--2,6-diaminopimelate ligase [Deltaproteobacteria bacterium]
MLLSELAGLLGLETAPPDGAKPPPGAPASGPGPGARAAAADPDIRDVTEDSRRAGPGALFCAFRGARADGRDYVPAAFAAGAAAALVSPPDPGGPGPRLLAPEASVRRHASEAARQVFGRPDEGILTVGITGTNGKSTVSYLAEALLAAAGRRPGVLGTVSFRLPGGGTREAPNTTPEGPLLWRTVRDMREDGAGSLVMEVSSHALALGRLGGAALDVALFTNLTRDHLDFHADMESYFLAKCLLFLGPGGSLAAGPGPGAARRAVVNADDPWGRRLLGAPGLRAVGFGFRAEGAEVAGEVTGSSRRGVSLRVSAPGWSGEIRSRLLGRFNAENLLAAAALARALGIPGDLAASVLSEAPGAPGRLSRTGSDDRFLALVDYAHAPGALEAAISAARDLGPARLIALFGCGGDRDRGKRPLMGKAAAGADVAVLTSDNPRTEDPLAIIAEAEAGLAGAGMRRAGPGGAAGVAAAGTYLVEPDRRVAIRLAVDLMREGDILLVAGKGHEDYQIVGREKRHFDDSEETLLALRAAGKSE